jgi:transposase InsO family protein
LEKCFIEQLAGSLPYVKHGFEAERRERSRRLGNESLFSRYKAELLEGGAFADVEQARSETFTYIEGYYNRVRRHSALCYLSPEDFERANYQRAESRKSLDE